MQNYGPFDKPYGAATLPGLAERGKALLVVIAGELLFILWFVVATLFSKLGVSTLWEVLILVATSPILAAAGVVHVLGVGWAFFPEWKPELRKRLTW